MKNRSGLLIWAMSFIPVTSFLRNPLSPPKQRFSTSLQAVRPGSSVLVIGSGALHLLTAKQAALAGYRTSVFTARYPRETLELIYDEQACPLGSIPLTFLEISNKNECEEAIAAAEAVILVTDGESTVTDFAIDAVIPDLPGATKVKHIVAMSRNLNGRGLGFFAQSAKEFANPEVWAGAKVIVESYRMFEKKVRAKAEKVGATYTIVRAGTLKGGGPGAESTKGSGLYPHAAYALSAKFYTLGMVAKPNWRMLFDMDCQGVDLIGGDAVEGPGFLAVKAAVSWEAEKGDSGRLGVATAMVQALSQPNALNRDFAVTTAASSQPPTQDDWDKKFGALGVSDQE
mmetsp:Transcript_6277/g.14423  ORF Transcript_6277/g.14423 Transcript_6277/m.14423 type:complete len:343 (+) Transcript_6277:256-1284(+)|eukprot:CAMPEP_0172621706 /NCGR_PEP_ID=MMETSP1068-20121228/114529_1 /TAXON_ID=35684 /ORGANISM="Pseudopedinella elastica, Strain CCMP716" /LENGTH=342 /DNA_ID=CAMNT_0013429569 /DNA_START=158 /DNA_END=1186 /DNA_ORIENTATION=+